jgi:hypothetical protein
VVEAQWSESLVGGNMIGGGCMCIGARSNDGGGGDRLVLRGRRNVWGVGIGVGDFNGRVRRDEMFSYSSIRFIYPHIMLIYSIPTFPVNHFTTTKKSDK